MYGVHLEAAIHCFLFTGQLNSKPDEYVMCIYIYTYTYTHYQLCVCTYIYIYMYMCYIYTCISTTWRSPRPIIRATIVVIIIITIITSLDRVCTIIELL